MGSSFEGDESVMETTNFVIVDDSNARNVLLVAVMYHAHEVTPS